MLLDHPGEVMGIEQKYELVPTSGPGAMHHRGGEKTHEGKSSAPGCPAPSQLLEIARHNASHIRQRRAIPERDLKTVVFQRANPDGEWATLLVLVSVLEDVDRRLLHRQKDQRAFLGFANHRGKGVSHPRHQSPEGAGAGDEAKTCVG